MNKKTYTFDEAYNKSLDIFKGDEWRPKFGSANTP
jgi:hypothetical protein